VLHARVESERLKIRPLSFDDDEIESCGIDGSLAATLRIPIRTVLHGQREHLPHLMWTTPGTQLRALAGVLSKKRDQQSQQVVGRETRRQTTDFGTPSDGDNEMFIVFQAPQSDELLGMWTQSSVEGPSLAEWRGQRVLWYPDRKYYLLGKHLPDTLLADMKAPTSTER
jgi:hypothetical protein